MATTMTLGLVLFAGCLSMNVMAQSDVSTLVQPPVADGFFCWVCPCGGWGCGAKCTSYPARGVTSCQNGEFIDQPDCDAYCASASISSSKAEASFEPQQNDTKAGAPRSFGKTLQATILHPEATLSHLCSFACDSGTSLFQCLMDGCPDTYGGCKRADAYQVTAEGCQTVATYFYQNGGQKVEDRTGAHESVAGNALHQVALRILELRQTSDGAVQLGDVTADDLAKGVRDLEEKGLEIGETALCQWTTGGAAGIFCGFVVKFPVVQWVNQELLDSPIVEQVTHQIATLAEGAVKAVEDVVKDAMNAVAKAVTKAATDLVNTIKNAATGIVHSVLNFFGWMENSLYAAITGQRGRVPLPELPKEVVV